MKFVAGILLGLGLGFLAHYSFFGKKGTVHHWEAVGRYNAHINNPANWKSERKTGLFTLSVSSDIMENLGALVSAGELSHLDLVFPNVLKSREADAAWMKYCQTNKEIVYASGNPSHAVVQTSGIQPLHLRIWIRPADTAVVQRLIKELEEKYPK